MTEYVAKKIESDFLLDGDVEKSVWREADWSQPFVNMATGEPAEFETRTSLLWSDSRLYVAFWAEEPNIQASLEQRDSLIFLENDLELFIDGVDSYYELEINALNTIYEVFFIWRDSFPNPEKFPPTLFDISAPDVYTFGGDYDRSGEFFWRGTHPRGTRWAFRGFDMPGLQTAVRLNGTLNDPANRDKGWSVEISIPWASLGALAHDRSLPPKFGDTWRIFLGRFQKRMVNGVEESPHPASSLRSHGVYDTHLPEEWSLISFEE
jgi:hypothetical protein